MASIWPFVLCGTLAYLLGSIPFGLLLTKLFRAGDLREIGSGNIGATNVLRTGHKGLAASTLALDWGKGALAVGLAGLYGPDFAAVAALCVVLGHLFPVWLRFDGGKGVATGGGAMLALFWPVGIAVIVTWAVVALISRYSSLAALCAAASAPLWALLFGGDGQTVAIFGALAVLIIARHHANIRRLLAGEETKIKLGKRG